MRRKRSRIGDDSWTPRLVTVIGHGSRLMGAVGIFVGAEVEVRVLTTRSGIDQLLAPYPGVQVETLTSYRQAPAQMPGGPIVLALESQADQQAVLSWLPDTMARFSASQRPQRGLLSLHALPGALHDALLTRCATLARVDAIRALAKGKQRAVVLMYGDPDPDAVGAGLALAAILRLEAKEVVLRYTGLVRRYQNKLLLRYVGRRITALDNDELGEADLVALVDCQPGFWRENPPTAQIIIDHHPLQESTHGAFVDVRPHYGSTSTMLTEYLLAAGLPIPRQMATALLYGLTTDTDDLRRHAGRADVRAYDALHPLVHRPFLDRLQKSQIPPRLLDWISWGISHRVVYRDLMLIHFGSIATPDILVQVADLALLTCGINVVVCAGVVGKDSHERRLVVVFRGDGYHMDVGRRAKDAFGELGSAGGHTTMGRAEIHLGEASIADTAAMLVDNLFRRMDPKRRSRLRTTLAQHVSAPRPPEPDIYELAD